MRYTGSGHKKKKPNIRLRIFLSGISLALLVVLVSLYFENNPPPPCLPHYTQEQINAIHCDNGPFIGTPMSVGGFFALAIVSATIIATLINPKK